MAIAGQPWTQGSLIYEDLVADDTSPFARSASSTPGRSSTRARPRPSSRAPASPTRGCTASPATRGTPSSRSAAPRAARARRSRPARDAGQRLGHRRLDPHPGVVNGVVGFKPPYGRVPVEPPFNLDVYCHNGPLARTVADTALFENVLAGPHPLDHHVAAARSSSSRSARGRRGAARRAVRRPRRWPLDPEVERQHAGGRPTRCARPARTSTRSTCASRKADVRARARPIHFDARLRRLGRQPWSAEHRDSSCAPTRSSSPRLVLAAAAGHTRCSRASRLEARLYEPVGALLEEYDALVCPTVGSRGLLAGDDYVGHGLEVGGQQLDDLLRRDADAGLQHHEPLPGAERAVRASPTTACRPACRSSAGRTTDETVFRLGAALERCGRGSTSTGAAPDGRPCRHEQRCSRSRASPPRCPSRASRARCCTTSR